MALYFRARLGPLSYVKRLDEPRRQREYVPAPPPLPLQPAPKSQGRAWVLGVLAAIALISAIYASSGR